MAIVVTELSTNDMMYLEGVINEAINNGQTVKVSQHTNGTIMVKRGGSVWTPLFGTDVTERPERTAMETYPPRGVVTWE